MKIVHLCLSCFYVDGFAYQENQLVAQHVADGHEVTVIASTDSFDANKRPCNVEPADYLGTDSAQVIRLPYRRIGPHGLAAKIRAYPGVKSILERLSPDVILFHGLCAWEMLTVARYVNQHPNVLLYADCHEDFNNSARTPLSKWGLHFCFYRPILRHCLPAIRKVLCISQASIGFAQQMYGISPTHLEFYPLGGMVFDDDAYTATRAATRASQGWTEFTTVFMQTGKLDRAKRLVDSLLAFTAIPGTHLRFVIAGLIMPDVESEVRPLIVADWRIQELGWVDSARLRDLLCAADVYVQPGSQSATMQMSLCCRCPVVLADVPSHRVFVDSNGVLVIDAAGLARALAELALAPDQLSQMSARSAAIAARLLDYRKLAKRLLR
jgi:1,2-diacylglycerol 3-alpha-glucosyltransferase